MPQNYETVKGAAKERVSTPEGCPYLYARNAEKGSSRKLKTPGTVHLLFASALPSLYVSARLARLAAFPCAAPALPSAAEGLSVELVRCSIALTDHGCHLASEPSSRRFGQLGRNLTISLTAKTLACVEGVGCLYSRAA